MRLSPKKNSEDAMNTTAEPVRYQINGKWYDSREAVPPGQHHRMTKEEFREIRSSLGLTQQALADRLGLKWQQSVASIESGVVGVSGTVAAHMRTLLLVRQEYQGNMVRGK